jgi:hypothetical protein
VILSKRRTRSAPTSSLALRARSEIGFQMLESLAKFLIVPPAAPQPGAWEPEWVAEHWKPLAVQIFESADVLVGKRLQAIADKKLR